MAGKNQIRILIADDHPIIREGLASLIQHRLDMRVVAEAVSGREVIALYAKHRPDIVLMDLQMPDVDGIEAIHAIHQDFPKARIIVLTAHDKEELIFRALHAGAQAFLLKNSPREQLMEVIQTVHAGHTIIPPEVAVKLAARMNTPELTTREQAVLTLLATGKTNLQIGVALCIAEATVKSHINGILHKMRVNDRTQAVTTALKRGLVNLE